MLFNSFRFLVFFPVVAIVYFIIPAYVSGKTNTFRNLWLLISSYFFYMCWNPKYSLLLLFSTVVTYLGGVILKKMKLSTSTKKIIYLKMTVFTCILINLSLLFYYKYFNFAMGIVSKAFDALKISFSVRSYDIILPVGISFFIFQALSYIIDVYRDDVDTEMNFIKYALFVSFFPQLVAGPIEKSKNFLKQFSEVHRFDFKQAKSGAFIMLWGFFLKLCIADRIALFVDTVFSDFDTYCGWYVIIAIILFAFQIYCDFAGYSTIALGTAKILGFKLTDNFLSPYLAVSVADFWRRWHISLTSWFKEYLYIPLGGSRKGFIRKQFNRFIVFFLSGLWHGASFAFIIWGVLNGLYLIVSDLLSPVKEKLRNILGLSDNSIIHIIISSLITFILIDFTWLFFRSGDLIISKAALNNVFHANNPWILFDGSLYTCGLDQKNWHLLLFCILGMFIVDSFKNKKICIHKTIIDQGYSAQVLVFTFSLIFILVFGIWGAQYDANSFIYFQF